MGGERLTLEGAVPSLQDAYPFVFNYVTVFTVLSLQSPVSAKMEKRVSCMFIPDGHVSVSARIDRKGFCEGEGLEWCLLREVGGSCSGGEKKLQEGLYYRNYCNPGIFQQLKRKLVWLKDLMGNLRNAFDGTGSPSCQSDTR